MIASEHEEIIWVFDLIGHKQHEGLERILSPINIVPKEEIIGIGRESACLEYFDQIAKLPMNIANYFDWGLELEEHWLGKVDIPAFSYYTLDFGFSEFQISALFIAEALLDDPIHIQSCYFLIHSYYNNQVSNNLNHFQYFI